MNNSLLTPADIAAIQTDPRLKEYADRLKLILPNGAKLSDAEALAGAAYAKSTGFDPTRGEFYIVPSIGVVPGYKGVFTRQSQQGIEPDYRYRPLNEEEKEFHDIAPGDKAMICWATNPAEAVEARQAGREPRIWEGIGIVRKWEQWKSEEWATSQNGKSYKRKLPEAQWKEREDPPKGRSWGWVAQNRALKDCATHMGIPVEMDAEQIIAGAQAAGIAVSVPDGAYIDSEQAAALVAETILAHVRQVSPMSEAEQRATFDRNVTAMRGPVTDDPFGIDAKPEPPSDAEFRKLTSATEERKAGNGNGDKPAPKLAVNHAPMQYGKMAAAFAAEFPAYQNKNGIFDDGHIRASLIERGFAEITPENIEDAFGKLAEHALSKMADAEAAKRR